MNFVQFRSIMRAFPVFAVRDVRTVDPRFDRRRLTEWQAKGYIQKLTKGCYHFADADMDEMMLFRAAATIYGPSYVSLETALSHHGLIPEAVYGITSATTRRTYRFDTPIGRFTYRSVAPRLFFGFSVGPNGVRIATVEKALLDFLYLNPGLTTTDDYASLRIDAEVLAERLDDKRFRDYRGRFESKALDSRVRRFLEVSRHA